MPAQSLFTRIISILAVSMFFAIPLPGTLTSAGITWHEGPVEFKNGTMENVTASPKGLSLSMSNESILDNWMKLNPSGSPPPRGSPAMAYDSAHGEVILFGGECDQGPMNDTWTYDLGMNVWTSKRPETAPSPRQACGMTYDSFHGRIVLFGGWNGTDFLGDTWTFDPGKNIWKNENPQIAPSARGNCILTFDSADGVVLLFGGYNRNYLCDTWTYDAGTNTWTDRHPAHTPSARSDYAMDYDGSRGKTVLFGGYNSGHFFNDTWAYDLSANDWSDQKPASAPSPCGGVAMVYNSPTDQMVLFGRYDFTYACETWTYDLGANSWMDRNPPNAPSARVYFGLVYESSHQEVILFGGGNDTVLNDTWTYDPAANDWTEMNPSGGPPARSGHAMVYDSAHDEVVLFGGWNGYDFLGDTWTYNLSMDTWTNMNPAIAPPARDYHAMAYDSLHDEVILFGGQNTYYFHDTWTYNLSTNKWTDQNPQNSPDGYIAAAMAYDSAHDEVILFGGKDYAGYCTNHTWIYNLSANNWMEMNPQITPPVRAFHTMVFDSDNDDILLFGGESNDGLLNDIWTYNVSMNNWSNQDPKTAPSPREGYSMAYDIANAKVVLFGGWTGFTHNSQDDTWIYDPGTNNWTNMNPTDRPSARRYHAMVYDSANAEIVLFGGDASYIGLQNDIWIYNSRNYRNAGDYLSDPHDTGGTAYFGIISWNADMPANTSLRLQFRSGASKEDLLIKHFLGPDGTAKSFYAASGQQISSMNNCTRWFQYLAFLSTDDISVTPLLRSVTVHYNLLQNLRVLSPLDGENWTGLQNITWDASDMDNDLLSFDIFLENASISIPLVQNLPDGARSFQLNTSLIPEGTYHIRILARDDNPSIPLTVSTISGYFAIYHPPPPNHPPHISLVSPLNNSIVNTTMVRLAWLGTDPENDNLNYTVYYASHPFSNGIIFQNATASEYLDLTDLADNTTYYWTVNASDGTNSHSDVSAGVWSFTVKLSQPAQINHPPRITSAPPTNATVGLEYIYDVAAVDPDNDIPYFSLSSPVQGMTIDPGSGRLSWMPPSVQTVFVMIIVSDGRGGTDSQTYYLNVLSAAPLCAITHPTDGSTVSGMINITGVAVKGILPLTRVEVLLDNGDWEQASGLDNWTLQLDTRTLANGEHTIRARALGGQFYSDNASVTITVNNAAPHVIPPSGNTVIIDQFPWLLLIIVLIIAGVMVVLYHRNRIVQ